MEIEIRQISPEQRKEIPTDSSKLGFGQYFTDHMFLMEYSPQEGWHNPRIEPLRDLVLHPAAVIFHYGQQVFEGLKAYRGPDNSIYLFRYQKNIERLNRSCERLVIPKVDPEIVSKALFELIKLDRDWVPSADGCALYIRPTIIATDPFLGVRPSQTYTFFIIMGPVGAYYPEGFNPVSIFVSEKYVRAVEGGTGEAKTAGNYAASLAAQQEAQRAGYSQVLWLDAKERKYVEEVGTMNIFFRINDEVITSPLTGTILPGVTRDSVIQILRKWGVKVVERKLSIDEVIQAIKDKTLREVFGSGTAAIISPVKSFYYRGEDYQVADGKTGELSAKLYRYLLDLQYGKIEDPFGWRVKVV